MKIDETFKTFKNFRHFFVLQILISNCNTKARIS